MPTLRYKGALFVILSWAKLGDQERIGTDFVCLTARVISRSTLRDRCASNTQPCPARGFWHFRYCKERFLRLGMAKNTTRDSINISLKLYFNINVKGDFKYLPSAKISTDRVAWILSLKFQTVITPYKQRVVCLWLSLYVFQCFAVYI